MFDLAADPGAIRDAFGRDPKLGPLVRARPGLRVPVAWDPLRAGGARDRRPAGDGARGDHAHGASGGAAGHARSRGGARTFPSAARAGRRQRRRPRCDRGSRAGDSHPGRRGGGGAAGAVVRTGQRRGDRRAEGAPRHWRLDGAVHRDARRSATPTRFRPAIWGCARRPATACDSRRRPGAMRRTVAALAGIGGDAPLAVTRTGAAARGPARAAPGVAR